MQAEILLKVIDPDGSEVTNISSLTRKTSGSGANEVTGFDITESTGLITIADNYEITSTGTVTQEWQIEVIFANLDSDQNANTGKSFSATLMIQEEAYEYTLADVCPDGGNLASCIADLNTLAGDGTDSIYYHDADLANGAGDNSYRYSGANPNNYVCFGAEGTDCQNTDNQYRIIGVFDDQVKLIKSTSYGSYAWDSGNSNIWDETTKPDIYITLNETYYGTLTDEWQNLINQTRVWQVGGFSSYDVAKTTYNNEVGTNQTGYVETMPVGLMYVSDYGYGADPSKWTTALYEGNYGIDNWLYSGDFEWLISHYTSGTPYSFIVCSDYGGNVSNYGSVLGSNAIRPVFYLSSSVELSSGSGTSTDPYRLAV